MTKVLEVPIPAASSVTRMLKRVDFSDAYEAKLSRPKLDAQAAYAAIFGQQPRWVKILLSLRGVFANIAGLKHPKITDVGEIEASRSRRPYVIGDRVGLFPVQAISANELTLGLDDKHLNFRLSVFRSSESNTEKVTISTVVELNNSLGRAYLFVIKPFHRLIVRSIIERALKLGSI
jgi:hypothetical protein